MTASNNEKGEDLQKLPWKKSQWDHGGARIRTVPEAGGEEQLVADTYGDEQLADLFLNAPRTAERFTEVCKAMATLIKEGRPISANSCRAANHAVNILRQVNCESGTDYLNL